MLQNDRRRLVIEYLRDSDATTQGELADYVAAVQNDVPPSAVTSTQRKRVYVSLYQSHLPKLADAGAIAYDSDRGTVERTPRTDEFLWYLERAKASPTNPTTSRARYTLAGAAMFTVALVVTLVPGAELGVDIASPLAVVLAGFAGGLVARGLWQ